MVSCPGCENETDTALGVCRECQEIAGRVNSQMIERTRKSGAISATINQQVAAVALPMPPYHYQSDN